MLLLLFLIPLAQAVDYECLSQCVSTCNSFSPPPLTRSPRIRAIPPQLQPPPPLPQLSPPLPQIIERSPPQSTQNKMTKSFPLGSCKMPGLPSLPYELSINSHTSTSLCFDIKLSEDYKTQCESYNLQKPCEDMIVNCNKIVFSYKHVNNCGYDLTTIRKSLEVFPWNVRSGSQTVRAGRYNIFSPNAEKPHAMGDLSLFKWEFAKNQTNVEIDINRTKSFKRQNDTSMNDYKLCIIYDPKVVNLIFCITDNYLIKYSFYDPYKTICTTGTVSLIL